MRATVLCILAIAGATCALQIPSLPSLQSGRDAGSSILGNIPGINRGDDSSSSSSSSEEDQKPSDVATQFAQRVIDDIEKSAGGIASIALMPVTVGSEILRIVTNDVKSFLNDVLKNTATPELIAELAQSVVHDAVNLAKNFGTIVLEPAKLKIQLSQKISHEVDKVLSKVENQESGDSSAQHRPEHNDKPHQRPHPADPQHRPSSQRPKPTPSGRPTSQRPRPTHPSRPSSQRPRPTHPSRPSSERPRPTHPSRPSSERPRPTHPSRPSSERPRPTHPSRPSSQPPRPTPSGQPSSERPRPTHPSRPSSRPPRPTPSGQPSSQQPTSSTSPEPITVILAKEGSAHVRVARDIELSISGSISIEKVISDSKIRNLAKALESVDFSKIVKPIPEISGLTPLNELSPAVANIIKRARHLVINAIAVGASTIEEAIQIALSAAIRSVNPAESVVNLVNIILQVYVYLAQSALAVGVPVATAVLKEAAIIGGSIVSSLLAAMSDSVADGVRALLN